MPVAKKPRGGRATVQRRPFGPPQPGGGGAENEPPHPRAADAPESADPGPSPVPAPPPAAGPPRPLLPSCGAACSGTLQVVLCNHSLWLAFHAQQNEMTLSRPGRPMFPFLAYQIRGLEPRARYRVFVDMARADGQHWRFEKGHWTPYAPEESYVPGNQAYPHPDSPNTGAHWMQREVVFKKLKLTNAEPAAQSASRAIWLQSQHRYRPRLHVEELGGGERAAPAAASRTHVFFFPETEFIAVTAYRNAEIIRLKIAHNPYAAAFRRRTPAAGSSGAGAPPGPAAAAPWAEAASVPAAGQQPLLPEAQARDLGRSTPGHVLQDPRPLWARAADLPPSRLPPTSAAAAPYPDRWEPPESGTGELGSLPPTSWGHRMDCLQSWLSKPLEPTPGAREQPRLHREMCPRGPQTDAQDAARGKRAPKKRRQCPSHSGHRAMSSARAHGQAQAQRLPAPEGSANASPEAASEDPGDLLVTEEAGVQEGDRAMPANCWALQQPQQPLNYVFDSILSSSSSSSSSNDLATLQVATLNPGLQISPAPLAAIYGSNPEGLLALLQPPTFPADPSQGTSGDCHPSLQPVLRAQEQPSDQQQMWPHLTQTEMGDSAQAEGAPQMRGLSPQASGRQARCSGRDDGEAQDQLLTAAASTPYTFSEVASEDPGHLLSVQETPTPNNRSMIPVLWSAPQQSQPPLHSLFHSTPSSGNSRSLPSLEDVAMGPSTSPLAMPYEPSPEEALFSLLEASGCLSETSQGTSSDCLTSVPSRPMNPVPGAQEGQSLQEEIWPSLTETVLEDSPQAPRTSETAPFSHNDYSSQDTSFTIADFYWDSLF